MNMPDSQIENSLGPMGTKFTYPNVTNFIDHRLMYSEMVEWIKEFVDDYKHTATCTKIGDCIYVNLAYEKDAIMFALRFGISK